VVIKEVCKMKRKIKKRYFKAVYIELIILLLIGTMIQSTVSFDIKSNEIVEKISVEIIPELKDKKYLVQGSGEICDIWPENTDNFIGEKWEMDYGASNAYGIDGWINDTNIIVLFFRMWSIYKNPTFMFIFSYQPFRLFFRFNSFSFFLPKIFTIKNYTGYIYCERWSIDHGPAGTRYYLSGKADGIKLL
jgi:hypothetical protein